ncbi:hypothetical protein ACSMFR_02315 [Listeria aquatica]|uniref:hypothetical protein n=1 Tax=Listeria aquatica TaxID=1494960 RepID=UPI003F6EF367
MMKINFKKVKKKILSITREEREKKAFARYDIERKRLESLTNRELSSRYVYTKAKYEFRKNIFSLFIGVILIALLTGSGKFLYQLAVKSMLVINQGSLHIERDKTVVLGLVSVFFIFIALAILLIFVVYLRELYFLRKTLLIMEEVRVEKKDK